MIIVMKEVQVLVFGFCMFLSDVSRGLSLVSDPTDTPGSFGVLVRNLRMVKVLYWLGLMFLAYLCCPG